MDASTDHGHNEQIRAREMASHFRAISFHRTAMPQTTAVAHPNPASVWTEWSSSSFADAELWPRPPPGALLVRRHGAVPTCPKREKLRA
jgi:hypothetical protein